MDRNRKLNTAMYAVFAVEALFSLCLIFNRSVWFDEAFTLSLIQHDFSDVIEIIKADMHPPLYFVSLKLFCTIFGYTVPVTKLFSALGFIATLALGLTVLKKHFSAQIAVIYMLSMGAVPMSLYFSVQQRSYQWCIFFVTLCFIEALLLMESGKARHGILFVIAGLGAAYNHIYALLAVGVIFAFVNLYTLIRSIKLIKYVIIADIAIIAGYSPWLIPLLRQTQHASDDFWLRGVEPLSVIVFALSVVFSAVILMKKDNRKLPVIFGIICAMGVQVIGLFVTIFIRPFYIARYSVVVLGILAFLIAYGTRSVKARAKKVIVILLCILNILCVIGTGIFEYNPSMPDFFERFDRISTEDDAFVYCDSAFGIMSYYYPQNEHFCTYEKSWFTAFKDVECIEKEQLSDKLRFDHNVWFVKNELTATPAYLSDNYTLEYTDRFRSDFNVFEVYRVKPQ